MIEVRLSRSAIVWATQLSLGAVACTGGVLVPAAPPAASVTPFAVAEPTELNAGPGIEVNEVAPLRRLTTRSFAVWGVTDGAVSVPPFPPVPWTTGVAAGPSIGLFGSMPVYRTASADAEAAAAEPPDGHEPVRKVNWVSRTRSASEAPEDCLRNRAEAAPLRGLE